MQEYFIRLPLTAGALIELPKDKADHAFKVLKLHHETVRLVSEGKGYFAEVYQENGKGLAKIVSEDPNTNELNTGITLCMALIRREKFELVLQKATELGVSRIVPFESERCVAKTKSEKEARVKERREAILEEAAEQCKRTCIPVLETPVPLSRLSDYKSDVNLCAYELAGTDAKRITDYAPASSVTVVIGPEGGFSPKEIELLSAEGFAPVTLGDRILRAETAAMYACSVIGEVFR
ncbi:MAG: 16S rRNA (uracil(1498)-N(3))-methyltransferase [Solobacterium sp.]|nr:16S rRNA (uracil(1498)-N(3))-methyltransferase [Solobacterium sp.]